MSFEYAYRRLPVALQNAVLSGAGLIINKQRYGGSFSRVAEAVELRGRLERDALYEFRDARLRSFVDNAYQHSPFWRRRLDEVGISPDQIVGIDALKCLPVLEKDEVKRCCDEIVSTEPLGRRLTCHTSGTTGSGLVFPSTIEAQREQWAVWWRYRHGHGIHRGMWCAYFGGRQLLPAEVDGRVFWRVNAAEKQVMFSIYHMSPHSLKLYLEEMRRRKLPWIHGYPSAITLLAEALISSGFDLGYQIEAITCGSENLTAQQETMIERAFGVRPRQHYGLAEAAANISECRNGRLHVDEDFAVVEFQEDDGSGVFRIVGTNLSNPAFPLIRYSVGDLAEPGGDCDCGLPGRVVQFLDGRLEDYIELRDGTRIGRLAQIFPSLTEIREAQFVQKRAGEVLLRIARGEGYTQASEAHLRSLLFDRFGNRCSVEIMYVDAVPKTSRGKLRFVVRESEPEGQRK